MHLGTPHFYRTRWRMSRVPILFPVTGNMMCIGKFKEVLFCWVLSLRPQYCQYWLQKCNPGDFGHSHVSKIVDCWVSCLKYEFLMTWESIIFEPPVQKVCTFTTRSETQQSTYVSPESLIPPLALQYYYLSTTALVCYTSTELGDKIEKDSKNRSSRDQDILNFCP